LLASVAPEPTKRFVVGNFCRIIPLPIFATDGTMGTSRDFFFACPGLEDGEMEGERRAGCWEEKMVAPFSFAELGG